MQRYLYTETMKLMFNPYREINPTHIVISPGPGNPKNAGISIKVIESFYQTIPILGVCLGHQCLVEFFGGKIIRAES